MRVVMRMQRMQVEREYIFSPGFIILILLSESEDKEELGG